MDVSAAQRLRRMEDENRRLKQLMADLSPPQEGLKAVFEKRAELAGLREDGAHRLQAARVDRSSYRYEARSEGNAELRTELVKLAPQKPRFGYQRLHAMSERRGCEANVKRICRLYMERRLGRTASRLARANQERAMDFIVTVWRGPHDPHP